MNRILVVAPHADDEVLGVGGTIAKYASNGDQVYVIIMTNAYMGDPKLFSEDGIKRVRTEALEAHKVLGVKETFFLDFPAPRLNSFPFYKISLELNKVFDSIKPNVLYLPHPGDLHLDHNAVYMSALVSARPHSSSIKEIYCYETLSETDWAPRQGDHMFKPNVYEDITEYMDTKIEALSCFKSQIQSDPHTRSLSSIKSLARFRGGTANVLFAESFELERIVK